MRLFYLLICLLWSALPLAAQETKPKTQEPYRLMIYGDSLSAGYRLNPSDSFYGQLQTALTEKGFKTVQVINQSKSNETTAGGIRRLSTALATKPNAVILELGINDILRGNSIATIEDNLNKIIQTFKEKGIPVLLIGMHSPPIAEPIYQQQFNQIYVNLSQKYNLILYPFFMKDLFTIEQGTLKPVEGKLLSDQVHPTQQGVQTIVQNILPDIIRFLNRNGIYAQTTQK